MKKPILALALALSFQLQAAGETFCQSKLEADIRFRAQTIDKKTAGEIFVYEMPKRCLFPEFEGDRKFGCLISGLFYGFAIATGPFGAGSAALLATFGHLMDKDIRDNRKQFKTSTLLAEYYSNPNDKKVLKKVKRKFFFARFLEDQEVHDIMTELDQTGKLCSKKPIVDRKLDITEEGVEYLRNHGYVPMDIILNDNMPEEIKNYAIRNFVFMTNCSYGTILSKKEIKEAVRELI